METLESECHDDLVADVHRATISLALGRWEEAVSRAHRVRQAWPSESFIAGFALAELGRLEEARGERGSDRSAFDRLTEMRSLDFATAMVREIWP